MIEGKRYFFAGAGAGAGSRPTLAAATESREVFFTMDGGEGVGPIMQTRTPLGAPRAPSPPPRLGQHSREVLAEYGLSDDAIAKLV